MLLLIKSVSLSWQDGSPGKELPHRQSPSGQKEASIDRAEGQSNFKEGLWKLCWWSSNSVPFFSPRPSYRTPKYIYKCEDWSSKEQQVAIGGKGTFLFPVQRHFLKNLKFILSFILNVLLWSNNYLRGRLFLHHSFLLYLKSIQLSWIMSVVGCAAHFAADQNNAVWKTETLVQHLSRGACLFFSLFFLSLSVGALTGRGKCCSWDTPCLRVFHQFLFSSVVFFLSGFL